MGTITEDYCSFEVAKLLKEKGFDEPCRSYFINNLGDYRRCTVEITTKDCTTEQVLRPTHQMAMKWLREKHIHIIIDYREVSYKYFFRISYCYNSSENLDFYDSYEETVEAALKYTLENVI